MNSILIVEDDENLRLTLLDNLEMEGYQVEAVSTLIEAKKEVSHTDLCVLDIMLPDGDGYEFCQWIRENKLSVLVLMLTARTLDRDVDFGFEAGADDYLSKPYRMKELLLRVKALLRRKNNYDNVGDILDINGYRVFLRERRVEKADQSIHLTKKEFDILSFLLQNINTVLSRDDILNHVWGENVYVDNRTVDNFIANIKKRLDLKVGAEYQVRSVRGVGYSLQKQP